jgi:predicted TIM-barrel fold metal-dependent hydrolase
VSQSHELPESPGEGLVDHHVHGVVTGELDRPAFERLISESDAEAPEGTSHFDSPIGLSIRRHCAPVLDLEPHAAPDVYLSRRAELGSLEANRRLLQAAGLELLFVDTGYRSEEITGFEEMGELAGARAAEVVRVEAIAEEVAAASSSTGEFEALLVPSLRAATAKAVGLKTIVAYRHGLDLDTGRPSPAETTLAIGGWLSSIESGARPRLSSKVLLAHLLHESLDLAADEGLVLQVHAGFGDSDLQLDRTNPALFTPWVRLASARGVDVCFLHCYPFHRDAGYLAAVFPNVFFDVGCILNYAGPSAARVLAEALEMAPFSKMLYSSDAFGAAELVYLGALQFRRALGSILAGFVDRDECTLFDATRIDQAISSGNARRIYPLERAGLARRQPKEQTP